MDFELTRLSRDPAEEAAALRLLVPAAQSVAGPVAEIIAAVGERGDQAVFDYTGRFDCPPAALKELRVEGEVIERAARDLAPELRRALNLAIANVRSVALGAELPDQRTIELDHGTVRLRRTAMRRAAVYVPGGRAVYPSSVVMGVVTALAAGVEEVAVCAPPGEDGELHPVILAACELTGAAEVFRMGGAQAVAALALGTDTVQRVEVIVGPGNLYVQEAKRQLSGRVGIDGFAGPSDLVLIADGESDPQPLALDLLAQAEHGPGTLVLALSRSRALLEEIGKLITAAPDGAAIVRLLEVERLEQALDLAETFAPEHLQLIGSQAEALAAEVKRAGCLFVGASAGTAFGDYIAGSNHVLPTNGAARFASGLTPAHFQRTFAEVRIADPGPLGRAAAPLARAEGFEFHARSMEARIRDNDRHGADG